jgi:threonylcarbamoyladenosine tRNA methylthiotransferase MtaB
MDSNLRIAFKTIGCRLNQAETARMAAVCAAAGYETVQWGEACDVVVIHGCAVTQKAESDSLRAMRQAAHRAGNPMVVLAGCAAAYAPLKGLDPSGMYRLAEQADKFRIPAVLHQIDPLRFPPPSGISVALPQFETVRAWVEIQDGCDFQCAYCVVPLTRGAPRSRPPQDIVDEIRRITELGYGEIIFCGANLGSYQAGGLDLAGLLERILTVDGIGRIRLGSIEVSTVERAVADVMVAHPSICRFLHLPLQSGSDRILQLMGRRYSAADYRLAVEYSAARLPGVGLGADVITGFPGETDADFQESFRVIEQLPFSNLHVFPFSPRPGTRAFQMKPRVPARIAGERAAILRRLGEAKRAAFAQTWVGRPVEVWVESVSASGEAQGWTGEYLPVTIQPAGLRVNTRVTVIPRKVEGCRLVAGASFCEQPSGDGNP